jgi:bifunctional non-homologous end joining protein LigD
VPCQQGRGRYCYTSDDARIARNLRPIRLSRRSEAFDSDRHIFELKIDGFRSLAYVENNQCQLVSRNGNTFRQFKDLAQWIGDRLRVESAVLDGEIACVDDSGRSVFNELLLRRRECVLFVFDLLFLNGEDRRGLTLIERKVRLKRLLRRNRSRVLYVNHIEARGCDLFDKGWQLIWRASWRSGGTRCIDRRSERRRIRLRSRIRITVRLKGGRSCLSDVLPLPV